MKQLILVLSLTIWVGTACMKAQQKEFSEKISKEVPFGNTSANTLIIKNVFGSIDIQGYNGDKVVMEVMRIITAKSVEDLELGKKELQLKVTTDPDRLILRPDAPYIEFDDDNLRYNWCNQEEWPYDHSLHFDVKVPWSVKINISTINDGEILVKNMKGDYLKVNNINGGITLENVSGQTDLHCINGDVSIAYVNNPTEDSKYYSLNGDINVKYQQELSANVSFKTMNGELFTDFDIAKQYMDAKRSFEGKKAKYTYQATPKLQIGKGGIALDFETLNGDVYLKKI
ncbi:DUF4097 family beta strand repeat protein [Muricauda sp. JGD-17]|uniref:DUF4097 family beta strand repeat protein n=1 Tax=Flagellimonas ochracea TaxID=2696472 RepID=A0A964WYN4_9FLAO|nr:DUF4097 family beta strand repeat-containing protein [Allomuricauda ochracea]NAY92754.1 DUF4097 family beta strand repeat protein [Allomuricauda ochracea]